jgi:hypothetical protein
MYKYNPHPFVYAHCEDAREIMTDVIDLDFSRTDDQLTLEYATQANDKVAVSITRGDMHIKAVITYSIEDGPRSRTETENVTSACLWTLFGDLNRAAKV